MFQRASPGVQQILSMDSSSAMILNPFNYHEWKSKIGILLRSKGLYRVSLALENEPNSIVEKTKLSGIIGWINPMDCFVSLLLLTFFFI